MGSPHVDEEIPVISDEDEAAHGSSTSNFFDDDLSFVNQFKTKKKSENEKLFEKSIHLLKKAENKKAEKKSSRKSPPKLNAEFEAEIRRKKEKMAEEKLAKAAKEAREDELREERLKKLKAERIKKNSALFDQFSRSESEKRKTCATTFSTKCDEKQPWRKKKPQRKRRKTRPKRNHQNRNKQKRNHRNRNKQKRSRQSRRSGSNSTKSPPTKPSKSSTKWTSSFCLAKSGSRHFSVSPLNVATIS